MKKFSCILLTALILAVMLTVFALPANAANGTDGNIDWRIDGTTLTISAVPGTDGKMPDYKNYDYAPWYYVDGKYSYENITDLVIEDGVTRIGKYAFCYFGKIKKLELPSSCREIAYEAFYDCEELETLSLYGDVGEDAFVYCYKLKKLTIGEGCTSIGREAFSECYALETVTLPASLQKVECEAFEYDTNLKNFKYYGTKKDFSNIDIDKDDNEPLVAVIDGGHVTYLTDGKYNYIDENGNTATLDGTKELCWILNDTTEITGGWYIVDSVINFGGNRLYVTADTNILLLDNCGIETYSGITVDDKKKLGIYAQSLDKDTMGYINVSTATSGCAGIGGEEDADGGTVMICGGNIYAQGGTNGAGIGSGYGNTRQGDGFVIITGGIVTAYGGAAGIGSGKGSYASVTISGGTVTATGGDGGAGIGSGIEGHCAVYISGGNVTAYGGDGGAGIGSGSNGFCTIHLSGGNITAHGGKDAADIGSGFGGSCNGKISGGNITGSIGSGYKGSCNVEDSRGNTGSILSGGSIWIIAAVAVLALGGVAALVIVKNKEKKPALESGAENKDKE